MKKVITAIIIMFIICGCTVNYKSGLKFKKLIEQENILVIQTVYTI